MVYFWRHRRSIAFFQRTEKVDMNTRAVNPGFFRRFGKTDMNTRTGLWACAPRGRASAIMYVGAAIGAPHETEGSPPCESTSNL